MNMDFIAAVAIGRVNLATVHGVVSVFSIPFDRSVVKDYVHKSTSLSSDNFVNPPPQATSQRRNLIVISRIRHII